MYAGFDVYAYDVEPKKQAAIATLGARAAPTIADIAQKCPTLVLCVFDTRQVEQVVEESGGIAQTLRETSETRDLICASTCDPDRLAALAARTEAQGMRFLEMPISGSSGQVAEGHGLGLIGGSRELMERLAPFLEALCPRRHYLGPLGNASRAKLAINLILGLNRAALAEGLVLAARLGLDPQAFLEVARDSAAYSQAMDVKGPAMTRREFRPAQGRIDQSLKDFRLMLEQARARGQRLPFASVYVEMLEDCVQHGEGEWDNAAILEAIGRMASAL